MAPTLKVQQIILPNVVDDVNFIRVPKMDRCQTCHLAIDKKGYEKYPQPFTTHPNLRPYLGGDSPHPIDQVGCTVCHEGMGQSVSFRDAAHMPADDEAEGGVGGEVPLGRAAPVGLPDAADEDDRGVVREVPQAEVYVPKAEKLNVAYATYERAGCYACHKTQGLRRTCGSPGRSSRRSTRS